MFTFNKSFFDNIVEICLKAGNAILEEYQKPLPKISLIVATTINIKL